jgi:hypothetical protein
VDIIAKYTMRRDMEIYRRELKTLMDTNALRSKSRDMVDKEWLVALTAYNMVRKIIAASADTVSFSLRQISFKIALRLVGLFFWTKKGSVFFR